VADTEDGEETREGLISYHVLSASDQHVVLKHSGALAPRSKPKPRPGAFMGPLGFPGPPRFMGPPRMVMGPEGVTLSRQGKMLVSRELTHLPFLLGDLELLVIEEFPAEANERMEYAVVGVQGDSVRLSKKYSLRTGDEGGAAPRFDMSGTGEFTFDTQEGVIAEMTMKYEIRVNEPNVTLRVPLR